MTRSIVFLSDFGFRNGWVGVCHAVIDKVAPACRIVDLSHGIPPLDVQAGALLLTDSLPFIRHDAISLGVVDPSAGRDRDIAVEADGGRLFVGPDNGLLSQAWRVAGGVRSAVSITSASILLEPVSALVGADGGPARLALLGYLRKSRQRGQLLGIAGGEVAWLSADRGEGG